MLSLEVLGQRIIVLNSLEAVQDLFEKRSANYSDRPRLPMLLEVYVRLISLIRSNVYIRISSMNYGFNFLLLPYGHWWRRHRRVFNEHFRASVVSKYQPVQAREIRAFLNRLLQSPERFVLHIRE